MVSAILLGAMFLAGSQSAKGQDAGPYRNFQQLEKALKDIIKSNNKLAKLESIGKTSEGRDLWLVTIAGSNEVSLNQRPGLLITANLEGDHLVGSELVIRSIDYLLKNYESDEKIKKAVDEHVFYFLPRVNPDGAERNFTSPLTGIKTNSTPYDGDNDGRIDEDGPEDLNGDGIITLMRVLDPDGIYMEDPDNPGIMKVADPVKGESGKYSIYWEGVDNDKDGFINEDPAGGVDINRNFQHAYPYYKPDAGIHMVSEKETRSVLDWVTANRNIAIMLSFSESDNLITPPNSRGELSSDNGLSMVAFANQSFEGADKVGMVSTRGYGRGFRGMEYYMRSRGSGNEASSDRSGRSSRQPATAVDRNDTEFFSQVSRKYKELTGIESQPPVRKPEGAFFEYGYYQYGIPSFSTPGWGMDMPKDTIDAGEEGQRRPAGRRGSLSMRGAGMQGNSGSAGSSGGESLDISAKKWLEKKEIDGFVQWQALDHPEFDDVEVGGFNLMALTNPPASILDELGDKHGEFIVYLSGLYADVNIASTEVVNHGGGLFRIKAEISNDGYLPTALSHGVASRAVKPTMVQLGVDPKAILSGDNKTNFLQKLDGSGNRQKYEWLIKGKAGDKIELKVVSQKAGSDSKIIELR